MGLSSFEHMKVIWVMKERYKETTWCKILKAMNEI